MDISQIMNIRQVIENIKPHVENSWNGVYVSEVYMWHEDSGIEQYYSVLACGMTATGKTLQEANDGWFKLHNQQL